MIKNAFKQASVIMNRELRSFFVSPVAYIVIVIFVAACGIFFFPTFFLAERASLERFFSLLPIFMSLTLPGITMRVFAEERRSGTFEIILTMPVGSSSVVAGKILAVFLFSLVMLAPTILYPITLSAVGSFDLGPLFGGYFGSALLALALSTIGVFTSALTKNQIVAFFLALVINLFFTFLHIFLFFLPAGIVDLFQYLSVNYHFDLISRGLIDTRNLIYFISIAVIFYLGTIRVVEERR